MGGGLLPCMGRLDFGWRLGCDGMPEHSAIRCKELPSSYLSRFSVDTMGFWAPHVREAVEVFGVDRVMFGTDYGPVPIDPREHVDIVNALAISDADKEKIFWRNAAQLLQSRREGVDIRSSFRGAAQRRARNPSWYVAALHVMAGLVPAIHDCVLAAKTWMPGTRPGMTDGFARSPERAERTWIPGSR